MFLLLLLVCDFSSSGTNILGPIDQNKLSLAFLNQKEKKVNVYWTSPWFSNHHHDQHGIPRSSAQRQESLVQAHNRQHKCNVWNDDDGDYGGDSGIGNVCSNSGGTFR